jgi:hypothetical protein
MPRLGRRLAEGADGHDDPQPHVGCIELSLSLPEFAAGESFIKSVVKRLEAERLAQKLQTQILRVDYHRMIA